MKEYIIPFAGLKIGEHCFDFKADKMFFETYPESEIQKADVDVHLVLNKQENMLVCRFNISGMIETACDRCLEEFSLPITSEETLIVKFGTDYEEISDDIIVIPATETSIDLRQHIYEYIMLAVPMQCIHPDLPDSSSGCNREMLEYLKKINKNNTADPRWEALVRLKKDNNIE